MSGFFNLIRHGKNIVKSAIGKKGKVSPTITSVAPKFPKNKIQTAIRDVHKTALVTKGSMKRKSQALDRDIQKVKSKLGQSMQKLKGEKVTESGVSKGKDLRENKMGGGMMGRRMGYSQGSSKGKIPTTPKEKSLAKLAPPKDRITFGDVVAGRTKGKRMQAKFGGGADTGKLGELRSKLGVIQNKIKRKTERLKKLKSARDSLKGKRGADI